MSVWKELRCDVNGDNCLDNLNNGPKGFVSATDLRKQGRVAGWVRRDGDDICPRCKAEQGAK